MATVLPQLTIDVTGESSRMLPPERAVLSVEAVSRTKEDKERATSEAIQASRNVETILRENSQNGTLDYWSRTSLAESVYQPYTSEKNPDPATEYTSKVCFELHVQKFQRLGALIGELSAIPHVHSQGVEWVLTAPTQNAQRSNLRAQAARNAREKAEDYAAALGYKDVWAFEARESAAYTHSSNRKGRPRVQKREDVETLSRNMAEEGWEDASEEAFQYSPEDVQMTQNVGVKFLAR